jgi:imidazolonepropionase-like amidohydrolase
MTACRNKVIDFAHANGMPVTSRELEWFAQSGLTPFEALQTATTRAAEALGEGANLGSIEAGKLADLVIVADDPLIDIKNPRKVRTVIKNGEVHTLEELLKR